MARLTPSQQRELIRSASRALRGTRRAGGIFRRLGATMGPIGELVGILGDILAGGRGPSKQTIEDAIQILSSQGFEVRPAGPGEPPIHGPGPIAPPVQPTRRPLRPRPAIPAARPGRAQPAEVWPEETTIPVLPTRVRGAFESIPSDVEGFSPWILCGQESSNVHSFAYDYGSKILYICFKADAKPISYKESISICSGKSYKVGFRPDVEGPIYSYGGAGRPIPESLFEAMVRARSKGKFVWDKLRVCGSQWQHQVPYAITDVPRGQMIPRKATRRGLRVRTVADIGLGRRSGRRSTLPQRIR